MASQLHEEPVEQATLLTDQALEADRSYLDLSELLQIPKHSHPSASGRLDCDYPSLADPKIGLNGLCELSQLKKVPLPAELVEQFGRMQCNCLMGLFPEISRAWLSIDSDIFVWNYEDGSDLAYFDGLSETILSAGLCKPKAGIFQPHIQYLLCLATPVDIVLLGVSFAKPSDVSVLGEWNQGEMHLLPEPLFSIPTDNTHIVSIQGAENGRIFMAGKDGCLYELAYQAEDGWFSRKCRKINHSRSSLAFITPSFLNFSFVDDDPLVQICIDDSRHILYTRSKKGTIQVYDLGSDGLSTGRVASISEQTTVQNAAIVAKCDRSLFRPIVHIAVIPRSESANVHLVAVSHTGVRIYFTTASFTHDLQRPQMLALVHVRLPPGFSAGSPPQKPKDVHSAHYKNGLLLLSASLPEENDLLWTITSDAFPFQRQLKETYETQAIDGRSWAIAEVPSDPSVRCPGNRAEPPAVVTQHGQADRKLVIINSQGTFVFTKLSPSDQLRELLLRTGPDSEETRAYFSLHKEQACATCLVLACSQGITERQSSELAARAFFVNGGEPEHNFAGGPSTIGPSQLLSPGADFHPRQVSTPFHNVTQQLHFPSSPYGGPQQSFDVVFSCRVRGLCLYLGRLLRPLWDAAMVREISMQQGRQSKPYLMSAFSSEELTWILSKLLDLRDFVDKNSQFASPVLSESYAGGSQSMVSGGRFDVTEDMARRKQQADAEAQENAALKQLQQLIRSCTESIGLWKILTDHQLHIVIASLNKDQVNSLRHTQFKSFVTAGKQMSQVLISSLIHLYLDDNAATDAISNRLREVCPSLYSSDDQLQAKANEDLTMAKTAHSTAEKEKSLNDALDLYKQITLQLNLPTVCAQFANVHFYRGVVDLTLTAASKRDPQGLALHFYKNNEPSEDSHGLHAYSARMDCYKCITETLDYLLQTSMSHPQAPSVPHSPGPAPPPDPNRLTNAQAQNYVEEVFALALKSEDELFHVHLYEWLIRNNLTEKLLEIKSAFLEPYLKRSALMQPDLLALLDLLWKFYEKTRNYASAAKILTKLADKKGAELSLMQRMEYLSRAMMCAKSSTSSTADGEFLHELEEKMEVARLQLKIHETISRFPGHDRQMEEALARLNSELLDITTLYAEFADRFDLSEAKLSIIHCAGHHDPTLVEALWQDIIEKEIQSGPNLTSPLMRTLQSKIVALGRTYGGNDKYFPLAFLVKLLEIQSCKLGLHEADQRFVFSTMQQIGVTIPRLHEIYDRLYKSKDPCWRTAHRPHHLLFIIHQLLVVFAASPDCVPAFERRHFTTTALDSIAHYLVGLQAETVSDQSIRTLINRFKELQSTLERLA
ncbi:hypothetical protein CAPTEDRAFT_198384 [Capitella teleta]|uniref:Nuclear pore complex protein Nup155 n=1 Tax=Capitella teleta TaxID=283909 RepID=R7UIK9_CAPTE|nr:hypothetical protein CAPTEDRAFT_198384 [Capitella teleta]|eukprot:ELU06399.1 hypothetical protein CAPTEDRAFT_198384 [Capitella teleta]